MLLHLTNIIDELELYPVRVYRRITGNTIGSSLAGHKPDSNYYVVSTITDSNGIETYEVFEASYRGLNQKPQMFFNRMTLEEEFKCVGLGEQLVFEERLKLHKAIIVFFRKVYSEIADTRFLASESGNEEEAKKLYNNGYQLLKKIENLEKRMADLVKSNPGWAADLYFEAIGWMYPTSDGQPTESQILSNK